MENNFDDKSINEIRTELKQLELDYEALKLKLVRDYDKLVEMEKLYEKGNDVISKRLKIN
jgi:hypothetical protein